MDVKCHIYGISGNFRGMTGSTSGAKTTDLEAKTVLSGDVIGGVKSPLYLGIAVRESPYLQI